MPIFRGSRETRHSHYIYHHSNVTVELYNQIPDLNKWMAIGVAGANRTWTWPDVVLFVYYVGRIHPLLTSYFHLPAMVPEDKKIAEANLRVLRESHKQPDNKVCADC